MSADNNIVELSGQEFAEILLGWKGYHEFGHSRVREYEGRRKEEETGSPFIPEAITLPEPYWHRVPAEHRINYFGGRPKELWPDPYRPMIHKINYDVYISRETPAYKSHENKKTNRLLPRPIYLLDCHFTGNLYLREVESHYNIYFEKCKFVCNTKEEVSTGKIHLQKCIFNSIYFNECRSDNYQTIDFADELKLSSTTARKIRIEKCRFNKLIIDTNSGNIEQVDIIDCCIKSIELNGNNLHRCDILNLKENESLTINGSYERINISNGSDSTGLDKVNIENFKFSSDNQTNNSSLSIINQFIKNALFTGVGRGDIFIRDTYSENFEINNFSNLGYFRLHKLLGVKRFILQDVSLGKTDIMDVDLSQVKDIEISHSSISDVTLNNTTFPKILSINRKSNFFGATEAYRQLKYASSKQGNRIRELEFEALEMEAYKQDKSIKKSLADRFILITNKLSNNHGQDWIRALLLLTSFTLISFNLIKYYQGYSLPLIWFDYEQLNQYLYFASNPLHDFDKIFNQSTFDTTAIDKAKGIDAITKVISAYLLFQFIKAFRKFVR